MLSELKQALPLYRDFYRYVIAVKKTVRLAKKRNDVVHGYKFSSENFTFSQEKFFIINKAEKTKNISRLKAARNNEMHYWHGFIWIKCNYATR
ncbi:MAG: hypothetical protein ACTXOO_00230 [Sodalis sp. (in: enterobacteria)]